MRRHLLCLCLMAALASALAADCLPSLEPEIEKLPQSTIFSEIITSLAAQAVPSEEGTARRRLLEAAAAGNAPAFRACPRILSPVCSTDGQQYPNDCVAANRGAQVACRGPCPCGAEASSAGNSAGPVDPVMGPCPKIYSPVCGLDGQTYPSKCVAGGAEAVDCEGPCPCPAAGMRELLADGDGEAQPCTKEYVPVCSVDGETFANRCLAGDAEIAYEGECRAVRPCPAIYAPVCSADNATYGSDCVAEGAGAEVACSGECPCPKPDAKPCPLNWAPVCGVDGATYGNDCAAGDVEIACQGECPCKGDAAEGQSTDGDDAVCMTMVDPVCSMDGETYTNGCFARVAGAVVDCQGKCPCPEVLEALQTRGGIVLVPTDDALLEALEAFANLTDASGDLLNNTALLKLILARHTILARPGEKLPTPSEDGTLALTQAGERVRLFADEQLELESVGTGPRGGDKIPVLASVKGCKLAVYQIAVVLEGPGATSR
ncbi:hypothetical protein CHLNCDRAFT_143123 [Chlorella variabilis]|uniref:Kazal-like domain-containing protein n=1 Tax=Chlorella variabilis TaxID=554065 RepID=E1Z9I2_CHLVA|nr:hypothetical protein CHLNCDRAFT_143123 [Chlorella variabilis]EFN57781.1 hypothetical protein CHLNCDRAFT_143123 [Chlorella variabilis]|eukprot:XP_005849883.1 hypothetical protein CHLNCDRAFT_143123 [Chlorella variabilis]